MICKLVLIYALVALAQSHGHGGSSYANNYLHSYGGHGGGGGGGGHGGHDHYAYPKYDFEYGVHDHHTGDHKKQHEIRDGGLVKGYYDVHEGDKSFKKLHYYYDSHKKH